MFYKFVRLKQSYVIFVRARVEYFSCFKPDWIYIYIIIYNETAILIRDWNSRAESDEDALKDIIIELRNRFGIGQ